MAHPAYAVPKLLIMNQHLSLLTNRATRPAILAAICILGLPVIAQANDKDAWRSVSGFLSGLGNQIAGQGRRVLNPDSNSRYDQPRNRYDDRQYARNDSMEASIQLALARNGYYRGPIDGNIGPMSRRAIANYQADRGLRVTGYPDGNLLNALGL